MLSKEEISQAGVYQSSGEQGIFTFGPKPTVPFNLVIRVGASLF